MNSNDKQNPNNTGTAAFTKEKETGRPQETTLRELGREYEIPPEAREMGVVQKQEHIEVPPDIKQLGVRPTGFATPVPYRPTLKLPITDEEIERGRKASILSSLRWLTEWCIYILKRFHLTLRVIHGKVMRVRYK